MAYPKEKEHVAYLDYVEEVSSRGEKALSKDEWRKRIKNQDESVKVNTLDMGDV